MGSGEGRIVALTIGSDRRRSASEFYLGEPLRIGLTIDAARAIGAAVFELGISTLDGVRIATAFSTDGGGAAAALEPGRHELAVDVNVLLLPHRYTVDAAVHHERLGTTIDAVQSAAGFTVLDVAAAGADRNFSSAVRGYVRPSCRWHVGAAAIATGPSIL
jgi:hypothetical protein